MAGIGGLLATALAATGCATIANGRHQDVPRADQPVADRRVAGARHGSREDQRYQRGQRRASE